MTHDRDGPRPNDAGFSADIVRAALDAVCAAARTEAGSRDIDDVDFLPDEMEAQGWVLSDMVPTRAVPAARGMTEVEIGAEIAAGRDPWAAGAEEERFRSAELPPASHILAALALSSLVDSPETLRGLFRPGQVAHLVCGSMAMRAAIARVGGTVLTAWARQVTDAGAGAADCRLVDPTHETRGRAKIARTVTQHVETCIRAGAAALIVSGRADDLPPAVRPLCDRQVFWTGLSPNRIVETLKRTHSTTGQVAEDAVRARLPQEEKLRRLDPMQVDAAFLAPDTLSVAQRLIEIAEAEPTAAGARLDHIKGVDEVRDTLVRMQRDLEEWRSGRVPWSEVTSSAVLHGPPGTGKTSLAEGLAGSAGLPFIATSYAECQKSGHQGDMLAALDRAFAEAADKAPAVLFIDELDGFSARGADPKHDVYMRGVVNGLLEQINRARHVEGLVLLGATNHIDAVDPAVIRHGRFDLKLHVPYPRRAGLEAILTAKLGTTRAAHVDLPAISERLVGCSGATAEAVVRDALGRARGDREPMTQDHLERAVDQIMPKVELALLRRVAAHEAGHVLVTLLSPLPTPRSVRVTMQGGDVEQQELPLLTRELALARLRTLLAGRAAEICLYGSPSSGAGAGTESDLAQATGLALAIERQWGLGGSGLAWSEVTPRDLPRLAPALVGRVEAHLHRAQAEALDLLRGRTPVLLQLTDRLLRQRELDRLQLEGLRRNLRQGDASATILPLHASLPAVPAACG